MRTLYETYKCSVQKGLIYRKVFLTNYWCSEAMLWSGGEES